MASLTNNVNVTSVAVGYPSISGNLITNGSISTGMSSISASSLDWTGRVIVGQTDNIKQVIYIIEEWQSKNPIKFDNGLIISFENDLYTNAELEELVYNKIEEHYPEKAIKLGLSKDNIQIRKLSPTIEIKG